ncbi:MAG TPA: hypothetical protein GX707_01380 [Epulopiscium sp.]|nr:hypothetical protein [Candidatus Epulonipiscium sp.]
MKKTISLVISASIFLQMVIPGASMVTYAQTGNLYGLKWEREGSLSRGLELSNIKTGEQEALVSWSVKETPGIYTLEYFVEDEGGSGAAEKVQLIFDRQDLGNAATVDVKVFNKSGEIKRNRQRFNMDTGNWVKMNDEVGNEKISLQKGSTYPGGSVLIGTKMEMRFRWSADDTVYVQANSIKQGNITPFELKHAVLNENASDKIEVLTGLEEYKISPIHIQIEDGKISNKETIVMPGTGQEHPGSKPGVKIEFKRPRSFNEESLKNDLDHFEFRKIEEIEAKKIEGTLVIEDLTNARAQLSFNLGEGSAITGLENEDKKLSYDDTNNTYTLYLAEDDMGNNENTKNIVQWKALQGSSIFKVIELSLNKKLEGAKPQALGIFSPIAKGKDDDIGRYTYLKYEIERSSLQDAYIKLEPYRGTESTEFTYAVETATDGTNWRTLVEHKYMPTDVDDDAPITIPVPFSATDDNQYYRITVKYSQGTMYSQILHYIPKEDLTIPPPTPIIQNIDNIYAVPPEELGKQPETIGFDLTWSAPRNSSQDKILDTLLEKGNIYYELSLHNEAETTKDTGTLIKIFKVNAEEDKSINVKTYAGTAGKDPEGIRYNPSKNTFTMENVVLKKQGEDGWEQIIKMPSEYDKNKEEYPVLDEENVDNKLTDKDVPGIYYLTMRALYEPKTTTGSAITMGVSNESNPKAITVSPLEEVIPVPTKIESENLLDEGTLNRTRQSFSWGNVDLGRYMKQMLDPLNLAIADNNQGIYEVYLYQKKNIEESKLTEAMPLATNLDVAKEYQLKDGDMEVLRKGGALRLGYNGSTNVGMNNIVLEGLDANQVYYTKIRVRLDLEDSQGESLEPRHSVFSKEHSFTAYTKPSEPEPGERVPPVPEGLTVVAQPNNATATIGWKAPDYSKQEGEELYYEVARIDSRKLAKEEDSRIVSIEKLMYKDTKNEIEAWHTKNPFIDRYEKETNTWKKVEPEQRSNKLQLENVDLSPNKIYYYYVRTVLVVEGEKVYSSWVGIPVTTDPIQKPIRLKVENVQAYTHDPKREIVLSFLAPIPEGAEIPKDYDFDIAVQGELDEDYRLDYPTSRLVSKEDKKDIPAGYDHFVYIIRNTKPGKRYDLKARVIDKTVDMVDGQYPKSLFSDRVTTRTHFDQDEQDKEDKFEEYLKYFEDKVEALRRKPYWTLEDGPNEFSIKYRSNYIIPGINNTKTYPLAAREGVTDFTYYMPASVIASTNLAQTSFELKQGNVTYSIRSSTITTELEELKGTLEDISAKRIRDYYIAFYFKQIPQAISLGADRFLTPKIIVDIELVRLKEEDLFLEDDIMIALNNEINNEKIRFISELERALEKGKILNEELDILINHSVAAIEKDHQRDVRNILKRNINKTVPIDYWNKGMLVTAITESSVIAQAYRLGWQDIELPTFSVGGGYGLEATEAGTYAFKGQRITMPVIPGVSGANTLIAKYQLTDFFGVNGIINPNSMAIKKDVLGAMARVLGAPRGADYVQYLKQGNIKGVTNVGMNLPMKKGEGIYLLMQVYEKNLKKPIGSVYVKNRNIVLNIRSFNPMHQPYVLVAADSKTINIGSGIGPNDTMQIKDVLQMLTNIMTK